MANPNLLTLTTVTGKTAVANVSTATANIVTNASNSNTIVKINSLIVGNVDPANSVNITAGLLRSSVNYKVASTIPVPANATLVIISKDSNVYLEEGDAINILASANNGLQAVCSYEIIG